MPVEPLPSGALSDVAPTPPQQGQIWIRQSDNTAYIYTGIAWIAFPVSSAPGDFTIGGNLIFTAAAARIIPGATSLTFRDHANANNNLAITDAGNVTIRGNVGSGGQAATAAVGLLVGGGSTTGSVTQQGVYGRVIGDSGATNEIAAVVADPQTVAASFTAAQVFGFHAKAPTIGAGSTVTTAAGVWIDSVVGAGTNYGIRIGVPSGGTTNIGLLNNGTTQLSGSLGVGVAPVANNAVKITTTLTGGAGEDAIKLDITGDSSGTTRLSGMYINTLVGAASTTHANVYGVGIVGPTVGATGVFTNYTGVSVFVNGSTAVATTNAIGVFVGAISSTGSNNIGVDIAAPSGASVLNIGLRNAGTSLLTGNVTIGAHLIANAAGTPTTTNLGANVTSVTFTGNDVAGSVAIVMSGALAANTRIATCTFATTYGATAPRVILVNQTSGVGLTIVNFYVQATSTGVSFDIAADQALATGTYTFEYIVIGAA